MMIKVGSSLHMSLWLLFFVQTSWWWWSISINQIYFFWLSVEFTNNICIWRLLFGFFFNFPSINNSMMVNIVNIHWKHHNDQLQGCCRCFVCLWRIYLEQNQTIMMMMWMHFTIKYFLANESLMSSSSSSFINGKCENESSHDFAPSSSWWWSSYKFI